MSSYQRLGVAVAVALALGSPTLWAAENSTERQSVEEIRNTVVNLLRALVDKGLLTREQAEAMVKQAQDKAATDAATLAQKNAEVAKQDEGAVRVPYVPQIVKDEISKQVAQQVQPAVVADVVKEAKEKGWGVPGALPEWLANVRPFGELTVRGQGDLYSKDNLPNQLLDFQAINTSGGFGKTTYPFLNTTQDRNRLRLRARLGLEADLSPHLTAVVRLASGSLTDPSSESQTFGTYSQRYTVGFDQGYFLWNSNIKDTLSMFSVTAGRMPNPWFAPTELVYARDLSFEGLASTFRLGWGTGGTEGGSGRSHVYLTAGGFPVLEVPLVNQENKWMVGAQLGANLRFFDGNEHLRLAASYYDFIHVTGQRNTQDSTLLNFTAPAFIRFGNSVFDISNSTTDPSLNLFALASKFRLVDIAATFDMKFGPYSLALTGEGVRNEAYEQAEVEALSTQVFPSKENTGYVGEVSFGHPVSDELGRWRAAVGYRYVKRDAVIDAWTDADFHEGGTNAAGYFAWATFGLTHNTWLRLRYLSSNEIDGARYGLDIWQVDLSARF